MVCIRIHSVFTDDLIKMKKRQDNLNGCPLIDTSTDYNAFYTLLSLVVIYVVSLQCFFATVATASCVQHDGTAVCCVVSCACVWGKRQARNRPPLDRYFATRSSAWRRRVLSTYSFSIIRSFKLGVLQTVLHARSHASIFEVLLSRQRLKKPAKRVMLRRRLSLSRPAARPM